MRLFYEWCSKTTHYGLHLCESWLNLCITGSKREHHGLRSLESGGAEIGI